MHRPKALIAAAALAATLAVPAGADAGGAIRVSQAFFKGTITAKQTSTWQYHRTVGDERDAAIECQFVYDGKGGQTIRMSTNKLKVLVNNFNGKISFQVKGPGMSVIAERQSEVTRNDRGPDCRTPEPDIQKCGKTEFTGMTFSFAMKGAASTTLYNPYIQQISDKFSECRFGNGSGPSGAIALVDAYGKVPRDITKRKSVKLHGEGLAKSDLGGEGVGETKLEWTLVLKRIKG